jgi:hypothetical protein
MTIVSSQDASFNPATGTQAYTILHRQITVNSGALALGTVNISSLSSYEAAWLTQLNHDRATLGYPTDGPVVLDEYDEEAARAEALAVSNGTDPYGDSTESIFAQQAGAQPGAFWCCGGVSDANTGPYTWQAAETAFYPNEQQNCLTKYSIPNGSWESCPFEEDTGHYINLAVNSLTWLGLGMSANAAQASSGVQGLWIYAGITSYSSASSRTVPNARRRIAPALIHGSEQE